MLASDYDVLLYGGAMDLAVGHWCCTAARTLGICTQGLNPLGSHNSVEQCHYSVEQPYTRGPHFSGLSKVALQQTTDM